MSSTYEQLVDIVRNRFKLRFYGVKAQIEALDASTYFDGQQLHIVWGDVPERIILEMGDGLLTDLAAISGKNPTEINHIEQGKITHLWIYDVLPQAGKSFDAMLSEDERLLIKFLEVIPPKYRMENRRKSCPQEVIYSSLRPDQVVISWPDYCSDGETLAERLTRALADVDGREEAQCVSIHYNAAGGCDIVLQLTGGARRLLADDQEHEWQERLRGVHEETVSIGVTGRDVARTLARLHSRLLGLLDGPAQMDMSAEELAIRLRMLPALPAPEEVDRDVAERALVPVGGAACMAAEREESPVEQQKTGGDQSSECLVM